MTGQHSPPDNEGSTPAAIKIFAPAKLNLTLKVLGRRKDGYHELESLVVFAPGAADRLTLSPSKTPTVRTTGPFSQLIGNDNLVAAAMQQTQTHDPRVQLADIDLQKNLPVAAGLGGGSADAAATLRGLVSLNPNLENEIDWHAIATRLGADVAACLHSRACLMRGIGDKIEPLEKLPTLSAVLANAQITPPPNKTAQVFKRLQAPPFAPPDNDAKNRATALANTHMNTSPDAIWQSLNTVGNNLEPPATALMPHITTVIAAIKNSPSCGFAGMSGAGPTCFGLFPSMRAATIAHEKIKTANPAWWVVASPLV